MSDSVGHGLTTICPDNGTNDAKGNDVLARERTRRLDCSQVEDEGEVRRTEGQHEVVRRKVLRLREASIKTRLSPTKRAIGSNGSLSRQHKHSYLGKSFPFHQCTTTSFLHSETREKSNNTAILLFWCDKV